METKERKSINYYMRLLHRNTGFFIAGFVIIYAFSGIALIYRDTDFLKHEHTVNVKLSPNLAPSEIGSALRIRDFKVLGTKEETVSFQGGSYNKSTGNAEYTVKELIFPFNKLTGLHKSPSKNPMHLFTLAFGLLLLFMAVSSFWMFTTRSGLFKRSIFTVLSGVIIAVILLIFIK